MASVRLLIEGLEEASHHTSQLCEQLLRVDSELKLDIRHGSSTSKALPETIAAVSLLLTSANSLYPQIAQALALWLRRPGAKSVTITHRDKAGKIREMRVEASGLGPEEIRDVIVQALRQSADD